MCSPTYPVPVALAQMVHAYRQDGHRGQLRITAAPDLCPVLSTPLAVTVLRKLRTRARLTYCGMGVTTADGRFVPLVPPGTLTIQGS